MKQNQQKPRKIQRQKPQVKQYDQLNLHSNCKCPPCKLQTDKPNPQIQLDYDLIKLKQRKSSSDKQSVFISFLNQLEKSSSKVTPNFPILDTIVFNHEGSVKYVICYENNKLRFMKPNFSLKSFIIQRKHFNDLQYQKKKYQREHLNFSFTQLDHQSQKLIKQFETNIKFTNPLLNRMIIKKQRPQNNIDNQQEILSQSQLNSLLGRISRKIADFTKTEYFQIFPIMYGQEQNSYVIKVKYFRQKQIDTVLYRTAEHYVGNWMSKNETLQKLQDNFVNKMKTKQQQNNLLMYYTCKLFVYFQLISNNMVESALLSYITNDNGVSFSLKNIETLEYHKLYQVEDRSSQLTNLSRKSSNKDSQSLINLSEQMNKIFDNFQTNYHRLRLENNQMQDKLQQDIQFSNKVYESLGYQQSSKQSLEKGSKQSFISRIFNQNPQQKGKIAFKTKQQKSRYL